MAGKEELKPPEHPIDILMAEHKVILRNLDELRQLVGQAQSAREFNTVADQLGQLKQIAHLLLETESHHQREEQSLFPRIERHGLIGPPRVMRLEHEELRVRKKRLAALAEKAGKITYPEFVRELNEVGGYIATTLRDHISKEDNILYPAALDTLAPEEWPDMAKEFDRIGYCYFTPGKSQGRDG